MRWRVASKQGFLRAFFSESCCPKNKQVYLANQDFVFGCGKGIRLHATTTQKIFKRNPFWKGKKEMSLEAQHAVTSLKTAKDDPKRVAAIIETKISRLLKIDFLSALYELQLQNELDLAIKVFEAARKEIWYKPDVPFYRDMIRLYAKNGRFDDGVEEMLEIMKEEKAESEMIVYIEIIEQCVNQGLYDKAMQFFERMKKSQSPPNAYVYRTIINSLNKSEQFDLSLRLEEEHQLLLANTPPDPRNRFD